MNGPTSWCTGLVVVPKPGFKKEKKTETCRHDPLEWMGAAWEAHSAKRASLTDDANGRKNLLEIRCHVRGLADSTDWRQHSCTFITPVGRYCFNKLPFGISSAPEYFQRRMTQILEGCNGMVCHTDDILVHGKDQIEHDTRLHQVLRRFREEGLTLNKDKCEFANSKIMFLGHSLSAEDVKPDPGKVKMWV